MKTRNLHFIFIFLSLFLICQKGKSQLYHDAGVTAVIQPTCSSIPGTLEDIIVVISNFGTIPITTVPVGCYFNNGIPVLYTYVGLLAPSASDTLVIVSATIPNSPFTFCAYTEGDSIPANDTTCICNGNPMSVSSFFANSSLFVGPNPSSGKFSIKFVESPAINATIEISDHLGRPIWKSEFAKPEYNIDFSDQTNGIYFIRLKTPSVVFSTKLLICK